MIIACPARHLGQPDTVFLAAPPVPRDRPSELTRWSAAAA
jgi:hypothetical protein